ncbi:MAG: adenylate/guanylate cyclase domain-containing protein [Methylophilaceae bacterium]|nr:adenylate/guanylate cyclase domain-containing protein [Methylophilaceae bacterium]
MISQTITTNKHLLKAREFWLKVSNPSDDVLGKSILSSLVFAESLVCIFWIFTLSGLGEGYAVMAAVPYIYIVFSYVSLLVFYKTKHFEYFTFTQLVMLLVMPFFMQWAIGGYEASSGVAIWAILSPIGALMILGTRQSTGWFSLFALLAGLSWYFNSLFSINALPIPQHTKDAFFLMNVMGIAFILYAVMRYFQSQKERTLNQLALEQARSEKLLLNILPKAIAERLKDNDIWIADSYDSVTIMFADIVGFTKLSAKMQPVDLVELLSQIFTSFDQLAENNGLEKIKTIGDGYMVVGGAPLQCKDHARVVAKLAMEMLDAVESIAYQRKMPLQMRFGLSSGPVVAGVIGTSKFSYDIWGDSVNMASRMEKTSFSNQIQVSQSTYDLIKNDFVFEARGAIDIKGKGKVETYILKSKIV